MRVVHKARSLLMLFATLLLVCSTLITGSALAALTTPLQHDHTGAAMPATYYDATLNHSPGSPQDVNVTVSNNFFSPQFITITLGTTVVWTNPNTRIHTVTSDPSSPEVFDSGNMGQGAVFTFTFTMAGTFGYYCVIHGVPGAGMYGTVTVLGGPTNTPTPTSPPLPTNTPTNTSTSTNTPLATNTPTNTPTRTNTPLTTSTPTNTPLATSTPSSTPTRTSTAGPTNTATNTPTNTATNTPVPTHTPAPTSTPCSVRGAAPGGGFTILILNGDENGSPPAQLQADLLARPGVATVDIFNVSTHGGGTPTLAQLQAYNIVVPFSNYPYADPNTLGDNLADYADSGGVIVALDYSFYDDFGQGTAPGGRWAQDGYAPFDVGTLSFPGGALGTYDPNSPLMQGVTALNADYRTINSVAFQATLVASWNNNGPLMAYKGQVVGITAYLGSQGTWSGDFAQVIVNAGNFLGGQSCLTPTPTPTACAVSGASSLPHTIGLGNPGAGNLVRLAQSGPRFKSSGQRLPTAGRTVTSSPAAQLHFTLDSGFLDETVGFNNGSTSYTAIWLNRFTPNPTDYPLHLDTIGIQWPDPTFAFTNLVSKTVDLLVYLDADGNNDPSNATLVARLQNQTITVADNISFQYFPVDITVNGPGDLYIGFADTYNSGGVSPVSYPAGIDIDSPQHRTWAAANGNGDPNYDNLGANSTLGTIEQISGGFTTGNWVIRAIGEQVSSCPTVTPTATPPPPTATMMPTNTPVGPTSTPMPTNTPIGPTSTPAGATATPTLPGTPLPSATPTDCANPFVDITGNVFYGAIHYLACRGVVNGTDATHYSPAGTSTRAQFAKVVILGFGLPFYTPAVYPDFSDVPPDYYAYLYIETGFHAGILSGFDQATCQANGQPYPCYLPGLAITRGQLTKLVVNAAGYQLYTPSGGQQSFSDVPPSNVFFASIETAANKGVISGFPDHTFRPNNNIRRDEMAQIVFKGVTTP